MEKFPNLSQNTLLFLYADAVLKSHVCSIFLKQPDCTGPSWLCRLSLVVVSRRYSLVAVCGFLSAVASPVGEHRL